jgi:hypothetical protein
MIVMHHVLEVEKQDGTNSTLTSTLLSIGEKGDGDSAMARTVGLTAGIFY